MLMMRSLYGGDKSEVKRKDVPAERDTYKALIVEVQVV